MDAALFDLLKEHQDAKARSALLSSSPQNLQLLASVLADPASAASSNSNYASVYTSSPTMLEQLLLNSASPAVASTPSPPPSLYQNSSLSLSPTLLTRPEMKSTSSLSASLQSSLSDRQRFVLFVKVLFKYIERLNSPSLQARAKAIIAECTQLNRMGVPGYTPLMSAVERRMKESLGEVHWNRAQTCMNSYIRKRAIQSIKASAILQGL